MFSEMCPDVPQIVIWGLNLIVLLLSHWALHCSASKPKQVLCLSPGLLLTGPGQVWFHLKKRPESILCFLCVCHGELRPPSATEAEKCVSGTAPLAAPLSWLAGAVASQRRTWSPRRPMAGRERGAGSPGVAKTTTSEWVCSWNAARQRLYNTSGEVREGEQAGRHVERLFPVALNLFISSVFHLPSGILPNRGTPLPHRKTNVRGNQMAKSGYTR